MHRIIIKDLGQQKVFFSLVLIFFFGDLQGKKLLTEKEILKVLSKACCH